jgi:spectinomycin phosphotransferase
MLTEPDLKDETIIEHLENAYGLDVEAISFLPFGADFNTAVYRVTTKGNADYFFKLRSGEFFEASALVPKYLADIGIKQVIPPITTKTGQLWINLLPFKAILYPYIEGCNGVAAKLSEQQWIQFGAVMKRFHSTYIPSAITHDIPLETFSSKWREIVKAFLKRIENEVFEEPVAVKTAEFLKVKSAEILRLIERTEELALTLKNQHLEHILCHADIHGWNLLIDKEGALYIVDWDTLIFAPKERDLMFIGAGISDSNHPSIEENSLFYQGYGQTHINQDAICYYRFERIIQDIGEYSEQIFLSDKSKEDLAQSFEYLWSNFLPGGTIERAYQTDKSRMSYYYR